MVGILKPVPHKVQDHYVLSSYETVEIAVAFSLDVSHNSPRQQCKIHFL